MASEINKITFLSLLVPDEQKKTMLEKSKNNMQDAANALEWHIYNGLAAQLGDRVRLFNILPVGSFPQFYSEPFIPDSLFATGYRNDHENIGFCNIKLLRKVAIPHAVFRALNRYYRDNPPADGDWLMVYTISPVFLSAVKKIKKRFPQLKVCAVVADLPEFSNLSAKKSFLLRSLISFQTLQANRELYCVDKFVLLTKQMEDKLNTGKPFWVMEGISTQFPEMERTAQNEKIIMYSGTLHKKFGIMNLVDAFEQIQNSDYRLLICGMGDAQDEISKLALEDPRIMLLGQISREEVLKWQKQATVLVNPRQNNEEFTKYSFPSKTMEYLSSGVPVVAYKLDGIPDEYDPYLLYVQDNSVESLRKKLVEVCELSEEVRHQIGNAGRSFVINEKNETIQMKKVIDFLIRE